MASDKANWIWHYVEQLDTPSKIDWLRRHRLMQYWYQYLVHQQRSIPEWLQKICQKQKQRALALSAETIKLIQLFRQHQIPALALKGSVLSQWLYQDPAARTFGDIDLLIAADQVVHAESLLCQHDYGCTQPKESISPRLFRWRKDRCYRHQQHQYILELHWRFDRNVFWGCQTFAQLWQGRELVQVGGCQIPTLSVEETALYLLLHGAKHAWSSLQWLLDFYQFCQMHDVHWPSVFQQAQQRHLLRALRVGLLLVEHVWGQVLYPLDRPASRIERCLVASVISSWTAHRWSGWQRMQFYMLICPSWRYRLMKVYNILTERWLWLGV